MPISKLTLDLFRRHELTHASESRDAQEYRRDRECGRRAELAGEDLPAWHRVG